MPNAKLIQYDFSKGLPEQIKDRKFDFIISTYAIHHLSDEEKTDFIKLISGNLNSPGQILIGDISFKTGKELDECKMKYSDYWDDEERYFVADEIIEKLGGKYSCGYIKMSHCAGILVIENK